MESANEEAFNAIPHVEQDQTSDGQLQGARKIRYVYQSGRRIWHHPLQFVKAEWPFLNWTIANLADGRVSR